MAGRLILNLKSQSQTDRSDDPSNATDMFFRSAYGRRRGAPHSLLDTVLSNLGEPLRVDDEDNLSEDNEEGNALYSEG